MSPQDVFKCDYTVDFNKFLVLQNKKTGIVRKHSRHTETPNEYEKLHNKYFDIVKTVCENNTDYKQIILIHLNILIIKEINNIEKEKLKKI